eukprot:scaffold212358_cov31-Prasinocladus_malaysianus.AAC.2
MDARADRCGLGRGGFAEALLGPAGRDHGAHVAIRGRPGWPIEILFKAANMPRMHHCAAQPTGTPVGIPMIRPIFQSTCRTSCWIAVKVFGCFFFD